MVHPLRRLRDLRGRNGYGRRRPGKAGHVRRHMAGHFGTAAQYFHDADGDQQDRPGLVKVPLRELAEKEEHAERDEHDGSHVSAAAAAGAVARAIWDVAVHYWPPCTSPSRGGGGFTRFRNIQTPRTMRMMGHMRPIQWSGNTPKVSNRKSTPR